MTIEEVRENLLYSLIHYKDSEHYRVKFDVEPIIVWVVKNRKDNIDKIEGFYKPNSVPKCVKRYYKLFRISIDIGFTTKPKYDVFHSELGDICREIFAKFKVLNKNKILNNKYCNQIHILNNFNRYNDISDNRNKWYYRNCYSDYYYNVQFSVYNDSKIYSVSKCDIT